MAPINDEPQFEVVSSGAYTWFNPSSVGRWFFDVRGGEITGVVWTDNLQGFGFVGLDIAEVPAAMDAVNEWSAFRYNAGMAGLSAEMAFEAAISVAGNPEVMSGPLQFVEDFTPKTLPGIGTATLSTGPDNPRGKINLMAVESLCFSITEDGDVLELLLSHPTGIAVRDAGEWVELDLTQENPTIEDMEWLDVYVDAIDFWDEVTTTGGDVKRDDVLKFALDPE